MNHSIADLFTASAIAGLAALGGAAVVFSEFDDAPGGILVGMLMVAAAAVVGWKALQRRRVARPRPRAP